MGNCLRLALVMLVSAVPSGLSQSGGSGEYLYWMLDAGQAVQVEWLGSASCSDRVEY
jgi:hypothetical protein